jgi:hypothetical protein
LLEDGCEIFDNFLGENFPVAEIVGFFEAFVYESADVEPGFVAAENEPFSARVNFQRKANYSPLINAICRFKHL